MAQGDPEDDVRAALREAVGLFNQGLFWECHEVLEGVWRGERGPRRRFLQGLIKVAAGYHHMRRGNLAGMEHLLAAGRELLLPFGDRYMGVGLAGLVKAAALDAEWARQARTSGRASGAPAPPTLELAAEEPP